jgi:hypothetical protein
MSAADDDAPIAMLAAAFEDCTLPPSEFHHRQHLQVAWWLLRQDPPLPAMLRFVDGLRRYAAHIGKPEVYHATITWAYLLLVNERLERGGHARSWAEFERDHPELFARDLLQRYYTPETMASPVARRVFVFADAASAPSGAGGRPPVAGLSDGDEAR